MRLNSMRYQIFFSLWCAIPSGRVLKKRSIALVSLIAFGFFAALHISSSAEVRVFCGFASFAEQVAACGPLEQ